MSDQNNPHPLQDAPAQDALTEQETSAVSPEPEDTLIDPDADIEAIEPVGDENEVACTQPAESQEQAEQKNARASLLTLVLEYVELFVTCLCAIMIVLSLLLRVCTVSGTSMLPTLKDGELLLVSDLFYTPAQGDIIIFHQTSEQNSRFNEPIIKRVIATPGQHVHINFTQGTVEVDGVLLEEDYIQLTNSLGITTGEYDLFAEHNFYMEPMPDGTTHRIFDAVVPEDHLFVMGDNRNNSSDSRTNVIGFVDERRVLGHVICRLTPLDAFGPVD
ncbi:MAG: signal peptidase I [Clostridia bacterium]|nr:signal peptidase I [Clostridia bacterium]